METATDWITAEEIARRFKISPRTAYLWAKKGVIPSVRLSGGVLRFDRREIEAWVDERRRGGGAA